MTFDSKRVAARLFLVLAFLLLAHLGVLFVRYGLGYRSAMGLVALFHVGAEGNVPTWYSTLLFAVSGGLFGVIGALVKARGLRDWGYWFSLGVLFLYLSLDEFAGLHERLNVPVRSAFHTTGPLYFAWILPYGLLVIVLGLGLFRFLWRLPATTRRWMIAAGSLFVLGALGAEALGSEHASQQLAKNLYYETLVTFEEAMEFTGLIVLIYALLAHIESQFGALTVRAGKSPP